MATAHARKKKTGKQKQLALKLPQWGGKRKNAGRKPKGEKPMVSHKKRPELNGRCPVHVTMRVRPEIHSLRSMHVQVRGAILAGAKKDGFRLIHFAILGNHIHLIAEASTAEALSLSMQGLTIRIAWAVNRAMGRKRGRVFSDRFHERVLKTPHETRTTIIYVINNHAKHSAKEGAPLPRDCVDRWSSAPYLFRREPNPLPSPTMWLLATRLPRSRPRRPDHAPRDGRPRQACGRAEATEVTCAKPNRSAQPTLQTHLASTAPRAGEGTAVPVHVEATCVQRMTPSYMR